MALSPALKLMVSGVALDPLEAKRAEILARLADTRRELASLTNNDHERDYHEPSIRAQLAWLGLQKATKSELREIIVNAMERDPDL
ncbi:hypothetical protein FE844_004540 [Rhizobium indicum]|uniref:hypothetical protein n=1 Tax=Rhizobium indicum TaxID=2583231 RepID=UPI001105B355|nr:hypothetical protein [Rhizobium indicum]QKK28887.1 hypothetical protein FE844_004540 [Rhizobium indicum]